MHAARVRAEVGFKQEVEMSKRCMAAGCSRWACPLKTEKGEIFCATHDSEAELKDCMDTDHTQDIEPALVLTSSAFRSTNPPCYLEPQSRKEGLQVVPLHKETDQVVVGAAELLEAEWPRFGMAGRKAALYRSCQSLPANYAVLSVKGGLECVVGHIQLRHACEVQYFRQ